MARSNAKDLISQESKQKFIRDNSHKEYIDDDLSSDRPSRYLKNPDEIIEHDDIPEEIKRAVVEACGLHVFEETEWTRLKVKKLYNSMTHPRENMTNSVAMICSPDCYYKEECPYDIIGQPPLGERCIKELSESKILYEDYVRAIANRQEEEPENIRKDMIFHNLITNLVEVDITINRLRTIIANNGNADEFVNTINQETGETYNKREEIVESKILERYDKKRNELLKQLLLTPEMMVKYDGKSNRDHQKSHIDILNRLEKVMKSIEHK